MKYGYSRIHLETPPRRHADWQGTEGYGLCTRTKEQVIQLTKLSLQKFRTKMVRANTSFRADVIHVQALVRKKYVPNYHVTCGTIRAPEDQPP